MQTLGSVKARPRGRRDRSRFLPLKHRGIVRKLRADPARGVANAPANGACR